MAESKFKSLYSICKVDPLKSNSTAPHRTTSPSMDDWSVKASSRSCKNKPLSMWPTTHTHTHTHTQLPICRMHGQLTMGKQCQESPSLKATWWLDLSHFKAHSLNLKCSYPGYPQEKEIGAVKHVVGQGKSTTSFTILLQTLQLWKARKQTQFSPAPKFSSIQESLLPSQPLFIYLSSPGVWLPSHS